jgi:lipopolysaccharide biosynthesis protein
MRLIAFYLPQFHPIPENDLWWGKGFTEWTNVSKAQPLFRGHYQPHLPADLGFYDLRLDIIREQQADLAREYGIYGFCYYYYWFNGRRLLESPLDRLLQAKRPDFPFCLCWANEPWSRNWDGMPSQTLMPQTHTAESDESFIRDILPVLEDPRYIRVNGRPLLLIYRTELIPDIAQTAEIWREAAFQRGLELHLCRVESFSAINPAKIAFDSACEFPPNILGLQAEASPALDFCVPGGRPFTGRIYDYANLVRLLTNRPEAPYKRFCGTTPSWDNTARSGARATVFVNSSPGLFRELLSGAVRKTRLRFKRDEQIVFINAWNEWAEGAHLEPDRRYGHAFLEACKLALEAEDGETNQIGKASLWETFVPHSLL